MSDDTKENLQDLWKEQGETAKAAQRWGGLSNAGFIGLVATEMPEFFAKESPKKSPWRLSLFVASSVSIVVGVVMNWVKGSNAEKMRESILMIEHSRNGVQNASEPRQWSAKVISSQNDPQRIAK